MNRKSWARQELETAEDSFYKGFANSKKCRSGQQRAFFSEYSAL